MPERLVLVNDIADDGRLIVCYLDGDGLNTVLDRTSNTEVGDIVTVEESVEGDDEATEVVKKGGWSRGNSVAVVEQVFDNELVVRTENGQQVINRPEETVEKGHTSPEETVEKGHTISITPAMSFGSILDTESIEVEPKPDVEIDTIDLNLGSDEGEEGDDTSLFQSANIEDVSFDDVIGLQDAKERLFEAVNLPLEKPEKIEEFGLEGQFGILFYGPPGTGKTMMAKATAIELGSSDLFFHIGGPEIVSEYYGESERQIRSVFRAAEDQAKEKGKPTVVFIDELDSVVPRRDRADETERRIVAQFLSALDGLEDRGDVITIGATNLIEVIDPAVRRPGRFDEEIEFSIPDIDACVEILKVHSDNMPLSPSVDFENIARQTRGWSGADLESIVKKAGLIAVKEDRSAVHHEDLMIALERFDQQQVAKQQQLQEVREQ